MHWRGIALTTFDGRRWYTEAHEPVAVSQGPDGWISWSTEPSAPRRPTAAAALYRDARTHGLRRPLRRRRAGAHSRRFHRRPAPARPRLRRTYLVDGQDRLALQSISQFLERALRSGFRDSAGPRRRCCARAPATYPETTSATLYLQLPQLDPRIPALAKQITARAPQSLRSGARHRAATCAHNYGYTLDLSGTPPADPLAYFLFQRRAGHCEYFAAAMTVMMR